MPSVVHRTARFLVRSAPFLPESFLTRLAKKMDEPGDEDVVADLRHGGKMLVNLREVSGFHIYVRGHHQPYVLRHVEEYLRPGMTFVDIGGHFGLFTVTGALKVRPTGHVHTFEPGDKQWKYLTHNVELNGIGGWVTLNKCALSDTPGHVGYVEGPSTNLGASYIDTAAQDGPIEKLTLDEYVERKGIKRVDALKIDVEGHELPVFRGFLKTLKSNPPGLVTYECNAKYCARGGYTPADVHGLFLDLGYTITRARDGARIDKASANEPTRHHDFVARI